MILTTVFEKKTAADKAQIDAFFERLSTPVDVTQTHANVTGEVFSPFKIIGWVTAGTGLMLIVAGIIQPENVGRYVNLVSGVALCLVGAGLYQLHRRFMRSAARAKQERGAAAAEEAV
jgi:hypothetical protein